MTFVARRGVVLTTIGVLLGCVLALPFAKMMSVLLYRVTAFDPTILGVVAVAMIATARKAAMVDPVVALRAE